jgi:hypothetical protein
MKIKIAITLYSFLILILPVKHFFSAENFVSKCLGSFTPYCNLTLNETHKGALNREINNVLPVIIFITGITGLLVYILSGFKNPDGLILLFSITVIYCIVHATSSIIGGPHGTSALNVMLDIGAVFADAGWVASCIWAARLLHLHKKHN